MSLRVLLTDDNPDDRALVARALRREFPDVRLTEVHDAAGLAQALEGGGFDFVISDYHLGWSDGLEIHRAVKTRWPACPVVIFTGTGSEELAVEVIRAGVDDYITKSPSHVARLPLVVRAVLERTRAAEAAAALTEVAHVASRTLDPDVVAQRIAAALRALLRVRGAVVYRLDPESGDLVGLAVSGDIGPLAGRGVVFPGGTGMIGLAVRDRRTVVSPDLLGDPRLVFEPEARVRLDQGALGAGLAVPLCVQDEVIGALGVVDGAGRAFDDAEVRLAEAFADQATLSLGNARLYAEARRARDFLGSIVANSADAIVTTDEHGRITYFSRAAEEIFDYRAAEVVGRPVADYYRSGSEDARAVMERLEAGQPLRSFETAFRAKDGGWIGISGAMSLLRDADGRVVGTLGILKDVTERKRMEAELRESQERFQRAFDDSAVGIAGQDLDGRYFRVNRALCDLVGYAERELLGMTYGDLMHPDDIPGMQEGDRRMLAGEIASQQAERRYLHKQGHAVWVLGTVSLLRAADGRPLSFVVQVQDISDRKRAEEEIQRQREALTQREKLSAMGELLGGVAHELNNPLSVVLGYAVLLGRVAGEGPVRQWAEKITTAADRCGRIVKNFLAMARQRPPERQDVDLNEIVHEVMEFLAYPFRVDDVEVALDLAPSLPVLWADPYQLQQVLVNLATNAHQAMRAAPRPRRLTITTGTDPTRSRVHLEVADTGPGIPPEVQRRIFEPFFTTKPAGQGTGLGLSLCHAIVETHGGTIRLESGPGAGAVLRVELPVETGRPAAAAPGVEAPSPVGKKTILVVDDEPDVGRVLVALLAADGHQVETVTDGAQALERLRTRTYDVILSDIRMPVLDGPGLYRELQRLHPELCSRFVFITGDTLSRETQQFLEGVSTPILSKPFALDDIRRAVHRALSAGALP